VLSLAYPVVRVISDNVSAVHEAPELTARSAEGFPGLSQATSFKAGRASTRSVRGVTPSLLDAVRTARLPCDPILLSEAF
jgi:hypothetical protein